MMGQAQTCCHSGGDYTHKCPRSLPMLFETLVVARQPGPRINVGFAYHFMLQASWQLAVQFSPKPAWLKSHFFRSLPSRSMPFIELEKTLVADDGSEYTVFIRSSELDGQQVLLSILVTDWTPPRVWSAEVSLRNVSAFIKVGLEAAWQRMLNTPTVTIPHH